VKEVALTPREFMVLGLLEENRYYSLSDIKVLYLSFLSNYSGSLGYLQGDESFAKIIWELMHKGYLVKPKYSGCALILRLSHAALEQVVPGDKL
jgi:hypothetical protein